MVRSARTLRQRWVLAWIGGAAIGVANGIAREATYGRRVDEETSNRVSVLTAWLSLTVAFEFTFGRLVAEKSWRELAADYNVARGRLWPLVLAWIALVPEVTRRWDGR